MATEVKKGEKSATDKFIDGVQPFAIGGLSGMLATCIIQPVDMIKIIIQLKSEELANSKQKGNVGPLQVIKDLHKA